MLTRLKISGFKNLLDVDVRFGPFTCIAGANGIGKSNLFDAIHFLSLLAEHTVIEAAQAVRGGDAVGLRSLFHRVGSHCRDVMSFEAEMIVPHTALDDLGQEAEATITFLRYSLILGYRPSADRGMLGPIEILKEELRHITKRDAHKHLLFKHLAKRWRSSAVRGERRAPYFISTTEEGDQRVIHLHQDGGSRGQPLKYPAARLPRTVLSSTRTAESPTALVARREMQSWRLLQLEPSALRKPDTFTSPSKLSMDGSHLAASLYRLSQADRLSEPVTNGRIYANVANRLAELVDDVRGIRVDRDDRRELLTVQVIDGGKTEHLASSLSDGTLRFLALAVMELDPESQGVICMEEPENGVHPERIPAMLQLLQDISVDVEEPVGADNPLRQVIINTHSPAVVTQVPEDGLLVALASDCVDEHGRFKSVEFHSLPGTWRIKVPETLEPVPLGRLLSYLNPVVHEEGAGSGSRSRRVVDRDDICEQMSLF